MKFHYALLAFLAVPSLAVDDASATRNLLGDRDEIGEMHRQRAFVRKGRKNVARNRSTGDEIEEMHRQRMIVDNMSIPNKEKVRDK